MAPYAYMYVLYKSQTHHEELFCRYIIIYRSNCTSYIAFNNNFVATIVQP